MRCVLISLVSTIFLGTVHPIFPSKVWNTMDRTSFIYHTSISWLSVPRTITIFFRWQLLWIILIASCAALVIQSLAASLGVVTGQFYETCSTSTYPCFIEHIFFFPCECCWYFSNFHYMIGKHLAEHCRAEYPKVTNFILWLLAELAVVACDIPEGIKIRLVPCHITYRATQAQ